MAEPRWRAAATAATLASVALLAGLVQGSTAPAVAAEPPVAPGATAPSVAGGTGDRAVELQRRLQEARAAHDRAVLRLETLRLHRAELAVQADAATARADRARRAVDAESPGIVDAIGSWVRGDDTLDRATTGMREAEHLRQIVDVASAGVARARRQAERTATAHREAADLAERLEVTAAARAAARLAVEQSGLRADYRASGAEQDAGNRRALARWHEHLRSLGSAEVVPPTTEALAREQLPRGLRPAYDDSGRRVHGVARVRTRDAGTLEVVSDVTVRAVSAAFASLGVVDAPADHGCGALVHQVWDTAEVDIPFDGRALWEALPAVPERQRVVGDLVVFELDAGFGVGIAVGERAVVAHDPEAAEVAVRTVPAADVLGVRRVTLPEGEGARAAAVPDVIDRGCVVPAPDPEVDVPASGWVRPVPTGRYTLSAGFGAGGSLWSSGRHTGQDFAAPLGTPVLAAAGGRVTVAPVWWAGLLVRVDHGDGVETWYAHMSRVDVTSGDVVAAGSVLGAVGSEGNSTGPHLHFEVRRGGVLLDPLQFLAQAGGNTAS